VAPDGGGHRIQLIRFPEAETAAWDAIHNLDEKRLLRLQRQLIAYKLLIIDELGYVGLSTTCATSVVPAARRMDVCVGAQSGSPARRLMNLQFAERVAMLPARLRR
jgi:hypothetical protein